MLRGRRTHLGRFDLLVDTAVGTGAVVRLTLADEIPPLLTGALLVVLGGGFLVLRNPTLSMALQAVGYAWLLWTLWAEREPAVWLPLGTAAVLALLLHRRLARAVIPAFSSSAFRSPKGAGGGRTWVHRPCRPGTMMEPDGAPDGAPKSPG